MTTKAQSHLATAAAVFSVNAMADLAMLLGDRELGGLLRAYQKQAVTDDDRSKARHAMLESPLSVAIGRSAEPELLAPLLARVDILAILGIAAQATIDVCTEAGERRDAA